MRRLLRLAPIVGAAALAALVVVAGHDTVRPVDAASQMPQNGVAQASNPHLRGKPPLPTATHVGSPSVVATRTARERIAQDKKATPSLPVKLAVTVGFHDQFRTTALVPVRITAHNTTGDTIRGALEIPDLSSAYNSPDERAQYQESLTLPPHARKDITIYVPPGAVSGQVNVRFDRNGQPVGLATKTDSTFSSNAVTIGVLTNSPASFSWIKPIIAGPRRWVTVVRLDPATFDPIASVLNNFDIIVIADGTVGLLDGAQLSALSQFVQGGGGLVEVGGAGWQQSLKPLPSSLIPGSVTGIRSVDGLTGLRTISGTGPPPRHGSTTISEMSNPEGTVLASQSGVPLVVTDAVGTGEVVYLAFDPTVNPVSSWSGATPTLSTLVSDANPQAFVRPTQNGGVVLPMFFVKMGFFGGMGAEIDNLASPALPMTIGFVVLAGIFVLLLGPLNFFLLGRMKRRGLAWLSLPLGAVICTGATFGVAGATRDQAVLLNTVSMVTLTGSSPERTADVYMGLFAPIPGTYHVSVPGPAIPSSISGNPYMEYAVMGRGCCFGAPGSVDRRFRHVGIRLQEGGRAEIDFPKMATWSMRNAEVSTTLDIPGTIENHLTIGKDGYLTGWVRNDTRLSLVHPVILAGRKWESLPPMGPGRQVAVHIRPALNIYDHQYKAESIWQTMLGRIRFVYENTNDGGSLPLFHGGIFGGGPQRFANYSSAYSAYGPGAHPSEHSMLARLRNVADLLPEAQNADALGEVLFSAFNQQSLLPITVNGAAAPTRNMNLIVQPMTLPGIAAGPFKLRTGTVGSHLISAQNGSSRHRSYDQYGTGVDIRHGGWATFEFQLPRSEPLHLNSLRLHVDAGGPRSVQMGHIWDWSSQRWIVYDLQSGYAQLDNPSRFLSPTNTIRVKLVNTDPHRDMIIADYNRQLQISGAGYAG